MKHFYLAATFVGALTACGNATNNREVENKTDTAVVENGLPLDNIHRSRGQDSVKIVSEIKRKAFRWIIWSGISVMTSRSTASLFRCRFGSIKFTSPRNDNKLSPGAVLIRLGFSG